MSLDVVFPGTSRMAVRMRGFDWESSPLGDPRGWPPSLRTAVRICLASRFPMIIWWGEELRFLYNDAYLPLLGTKHPALDKPGEVVWTEIWHIIGPMLRGVLETGEATWSEDLLLPMNRHGYHEETYWTYSYSPLYDEQGRVRAVFTAVSDTTERVIGERRLASLRDLGAQAGIARTPEEACRLVAGVLRECGADVPYAALYLRDEVTGAPRFAASTIDGDGHRDGWPIAEVLAGGEARVVSDVVERFGELPSGGWAKPPVEAMVLPLPGETGTGTVGVAVLAASSGRALDEAYRTFLGLVARETGALVNSAFAYRFQQRRAEELAALDEAKTRFFSNISHEFRTPLTLIMGPVEELREHITDEALREEVEVIHRNGLRLGRLVNNLLDFSRIEAGRMQARYEPVDLAEFTAELASVFRAAVEKAGLRFDVDTGALGDVVFVDRGMWEKVVLNLLSNAVKYTFAGGIRVAVREVDGEAEVTVADSGIGIEAAEMPRLFERFHRIPSARARSNEGSGIGLALVRELVRLHRGTIVADSEPGVGTTFTIRLPLGSGHLPPEHVVHDATATGVAQESVDPFLQEALRWLPDAADETAAETPAEAGGAVAAGEGKPRILIADDNTDMRAYLRRLLKARYEVETVADGEAALAAARAVPPDLVVSDVMMPRLDGLGLLSALREDARTAGVPVLLLSARAGQEAAIEGLAAGADDYLVKPFSARELLARVRATVELARIRTQHARWRTAMIESLQEGFFVCDASTAVVEVNAAFAELLGYGPEGLPYATPHPWWPDAVRDPGAHADAERAFGRVAAEASGRFEVQLRHRDGHRVWVALTFNALRDDTSRRMVVGTMRDVTADRYLVQRESALAALGQRLAQAAGEPDVVHTALEFLKDLWRARCVLAVTWRGGAQPELTSTLAAHQSWTDLSEPLREEIEHLRELPPLHAATAGGTTGVTGVGTTLDHPDGQLSVWVEPDPARPLGTEDETLLVLLCGTLAQALRRAHVTDQQRDVALALQRSVLGPAVPPGFAVRYEPATPPLEVGGDWYDVVPLSDGRTGIVVGDCVGRGLAAAAVMGQLRSACRALLLEATSPRGVLTALDRFAGQLPGAVCTTVFCGVLDPATGELVYSSAGHPPGILVDAAGATGLLEDGAGVPLAIGGGAPRPEATVVVPPDGLLVLYTDGLVERRGQPLDAGIDRAAAVARDRRTADLEDVASSLMKLLQPVSGYDDDVALLLYRRLVPELERSFAAEPENLAPIRAELRSWCAQAGLAEEQTQDVLVAVGEAVTNSIEHAYRGARERVVIRLRLEGGVLTAVVGDTGHWRVPPPDNHVLRGRGLAMMRALAEHVTVDTTEAGTTVTMQWRVE